MKVQLRNISNLNTLEEIKRASSINFGMIQDAMADVRGKIWIILNRFIGSADN